jgi:hypothetical protein
MFLCRILSACFYEMNIQHFISTSIPKRGHFEHLFSLFQYYNGVCFVLFSGIFTVMCYNVLCDKYATRQMYGYCPSWALEWEYRKKGILDEIRHYAADIISLQVSKFVNCLTYKCFLSQVRINQIRSFYTQL